MKDVWGFRITMASMPKIKEDYLKADIEFFRAKLKYEAWRDLQMFIKSREKIDEISGKYSVFKGLKFGDMAVETVQNWFEVLTMDKFDIMEFEILSGLNQTILEVKFNAEYFALWDSMRSGSAMHRMAFRNALTNKDSLLKQFEKQIKAVYTKDYKVDIIAS